MYDSLFYYTREMYREFCCCTEEVQNRILEYCELDLRISLREDFYHECLEAIESALKERFPNDDDLLYENGKYLFRSLRIYGSEAMPYTEFEYDNHLTDILASAFRFADTTATPLADLKVEYGFEICPEIEACQLVTTIARYSAIYAVIEKNDASYGSPGGYDDEKISTMEDLFLLAMFDIYTNLVLKD